jgi:hypothetical protein
MFVSFPWCPTSPWLPCLKLRQEWYWSIFQREIIITLKNSSHLEWRVGLSDTILKGTLPGTIYAKFGSIWLSCFRGEDFFNISQSMRFHFNWKWGHQWPYPSPVLTSVSWIFRQNFTLLKVVVYSTLLVKKFSSFLSVCFHYYFLSNPHHFRIPVNNGCPTFKWQFVSFKDHLAFTRENLKQWQF